MKKVNVVRKNAERSIDAVIAGNRWLTSATIDKVAKVLVEDWFVREVIYPKEISGCKIIDCGGYRRLYNGDETPFSLKADFFSAEKIVIQQRSNDFDHWNTDERFELTSLWPEKQLVIAVEHDTQQLIAFAPIFIAPRSKKISPKTRFEFHEFMEELQAYCDHVKKTHNGTFPPSTLSIMLHSISLLYWLRDHCV